MTINFSSIDFVCWGLQAYAAQKGKEYLDKPAVHETMVKVLIDLADDAHGPTVHSGIFELTPYYFSVHVLTHGIVAGLQVAGYLLGEYSHLLARRPGCSPKEIFIIIHDKFPTVSYIHNPH